MQSMVQDLMSGVRTFVRRPGFAFVAAGTLALGIGAHAALFSVVDGVLLRPVDLPDADDLVVVRMQVDGELRNLTGPNAADLIRATDDVFTAAGGFWASQVTLDTPEGTREYRAGVGATPGVFGALGVPLQLGRPWGPEMVGTGVPISAVVISDRLWRARFGGDPDIVGTTIYASGSSAVVTGVLPAGFEFPTIEDADIIFPPIRDPDDLARAGLGAFTILARLRPGVSPEQARDAVQRAWEGLREEHPGDLAQNDIAMLGLQDFMTRDVRPALLALLGATSLLLLLACANVANLMLARGIGRETELSVRASLGAGRGRLTRQLLTESAVLATVAGLAGVVVAVGLLAALGAVAPAELGGVAEARLSPRAFGVALVVALACALLAGLVPALRSSAAGASGALRSGTRATTGRGLRRVQGSLVVAQVAAAVVLAVGAGLLGRSFLTLSDVDPGYRTDGVLTAGISLPDELYADRASRAGAFDRIEREVAALPGVQRVGTTIRAPFSTGELAVPVRLADDESMTLDQAPRVEITVVSPGYIEALGIPLLRGRNFTDADGSESPRVAVISESLARSLFGDENPVGRRLTPVLGPWDQATNWAEVVGVVGDVRLQSLDAAAEGMLYMAATQMAQGYGTLVVHTAGDPAALTAAVREAILRVEPRMVEPSIQTLAGQRAETLARPRFNSLLFGVLSTLALALAAVGIYGLLSYSVATRRLELGVRMAVGADRWAVLRLVLTQGLKLAGLGLLIGLTGALLVGQGLSALLFGVEPTDPATLGGTLAVVAAIALAGSLVPALRAAGGDAIEALRVE